MHCAMPCAMRAMRAMRVPCICHLRVDERERELEREAEGGRCGCRDRFGCLLQARRAEGWWCTHAGAVSALLCHSVGVDTGGGVMRRVLLQYSIELDEAAGHVVVVLWQVPRSAHAARSAQRIQCTAHGAQRTTQCLARRTVPLVLFL